MSRQLRRALLVSALLTGLLATGSPALAASGGVRQDPEVGAPNLRAHRDITHGTVVRAPTRTSPWALSLWLEKKEGSTGTGTVEFLCSGTAIGPREILTAAHCTTEPGFLYAKVGVDSLMTKGHLVPVEAVGRNSRYRTRAFHDDIALLRPLFDLGLPAYATLATPAVTARVRSGGAPLTALGWGMTEDGALTGQLRRSVLAIAPRPTLSAFGPDYVAGTMIAAGRLDRRTHLWSGTCGGDSGGPLTTRAAGVTYVVGVTNFGPKACDSAPSVFASVGDFTRWSRATRRALPVLARTANAARPVALSPPTVSGTVALGQTLTCAASAWSPNATTFAVGWWRGDAELGPGASHVVVVEDAGATLHCVSAAGSKAGASVVEAPDLVVPEAPRFDGIATLTGLSLEVAPAPGTVVACGGVSPSTPATTTTYDWLSSPTGAVADAVAIAVGPALTLDAPLLQQLAGQVLLCRATTTNVMGSVSDVAAAVIPAVVVPPAAGTLP